MFCRSSSGLWVGFKHRGQEEERGQHFTPICPETGSGLSEPHEAGCRSREDGRAELGAHTVSCQVCRLTVLLVFPLFSRLYLAESAFVVKWHTEHSSELVSLHNAPEVLAWNNQWALRLTLQGVAAPAKPGKSSPSRHKVATHDHWVNKARD